MKMKNLAVACALITATISFNALAESSNVCTDPLTKVCVETQGRIAAKKQAIKKLQEEIRAEAAISAAPKIEEMEKKIWKIRYFTRAVKRFKIMNKEVMDVASKKVVGLEQGLDSASIAQIKSYMNKAIDESKLAVNYKSQFKQIISEVHIGSFADFIEKTDIDEKLFDQLQSPCGLDGLVENAFATTIKGEKYVLICPGTYVTLSQTPDQKEKIETILQTIGHEMSHHIDASSIKDLKPYVPFLGCLADNYIDKFNKTEKDEKFCKKEFKDPKEAEANKAACAARTVVSHAGELIADAWATKLINIYVREQNYSSGETDTLLVNSYSSLCGTKDEGIHPTGDFRIGSLLGMDTELSDYMACQKPVGSKPACTIDGAVNF